jgi:xyloglucan-specific exo-beta-1,4-glucanase
MAVSVHLLPVLSMYYHLYPLEIFRSTNGGATWSRLWEWASYPNMNRYYKYDTSLAPWISVTAADDTKQIGWMMEALADVI